MSKNTDITMDRCLTSDEVFAFVVYPTDPAKAEQAAHIRVCPHCRHRVMELLDSRDDTFGITLEEFYSVLSILKEAKDLNIPH